MPNSQTTRFNGRCKVIFIGAPSPTLRELTPFVRKHLPLSSIVELPSYPSRETFSDALRLPMLTFCFVSVVNARDPALEIIPELSRFDAKLGIVAVIPENEPDLILRCLRLGASDFLLPPFTDEQVDSAFQKLIATHPQPESANPPGKVYCVIPTKGACGATTVACDLAYQWKRRGAKRILLADLDPLTGVIGFVLKMKAQSSFIDVLQRAADLDTDLWKGMVSDRNGVDVLLPPETVADGASELTDASPILDYARYHYDVSVIDAGAAYGDWTLSQAQLSDEVILVSTNELEALRAAQRVLQYLETNGIARWKIRLVVNRYDREIGVNPQTLEGALQAILYHVLPSDFDAVQRALLEGKPIASSAALGKALAALADKLAGQEPPAAKKASSLAGLLSIFSRG